MDEQTWPQLSSAIGAYGNRMRDAWAAHGLLYVPDPNLGQFPNFSRAPTLLMSGTNPSYHVELLTLYTILSMACVVQLTPHEVAGSLDANTPPEWATDLARSNSGVTQQIYPGATHVVIQNSACGIEPVTTFLISDGRVLPSGDCLRQVLNPHIPPHSTTNDEAHCVTCVVQLTPPTIAERIGLGRVVGRCQCHGGVCIWDDRTVWAVTCAARMRYHSARQPLMARMAMRAVHGHVGFCRMSRHVCLCTRQENWTLCSQIDCTT